MTNNNDENFLFGKNNTLLNEQIILPIVSSFLPEEESIKVTKMILEDDSIINVANYDNVDKVYNPLESLNDDDAVIPIAYYKNNSS